MRRGENRRAAFAGLVVYVALVAALFWLSPNREESLRRRGAGSSRSISPSGLARLHGVCEAEGVPIARLEDDDWTPDDVSVLIVEPAQTPPPPVLTDLARVVGEGAATVVAAGDRDQLARLARPLRLGEIPATVETPDPAPVALSGSSVAMHRVGTGGRDTPDEAATVRAFDVLPDGFTTLVAASDGSPVVVTRPYGAGLVVLVSEPRLFENGWLDCWDNIELVVTLLGSRDRVAFDDRWQPRESIERAATEMMDLVYGTGPGRAVTFLVLTGGFVAFLTGLFPGGPARRRRHVRRPTAYVDALAELQGSRRSQGPLLAHFQQRFRVRAARALGLPPDVDAATLAARLAARVPESEPEIIRLMTRQVPARHVAAAVAGLDRIQRVLGR